MTTTSFVVDKDSDVRLFTIDRCWLERKFGLTDWEIDADALDYVPVQAINVNHSTVTFESDKLSQAVGSRFQFVFEDAISQRVSSGWLPWQVVAAVLGDGPKTVTLETPALLRLRSEFGGVITEVSAVRLTSTLAAEFRVAGLWVKAEQFANDVRGLAELIREIAISL